MHDLMIDLETLGTGPTAIIMAIGAVKFDLVTGRTDDNGFYASVSVDSNLAAGRTMDESTLVWWMGQSPEARRVFTEEKMHLGAALEQFAEWVGDPQHVRPWGNGPTFDLCKVSHAYEQQGLEAPWKYYNERCVRTYRALPGAKTIPKCLPFVAHHALHDAYAQAQHLIAIHKAVFIDGVKKNAMVKA